MRAFLAREAFRVAAEIEDGVADELARTVVGDVAAAIDLVDFYTFVSEELVSGEDIGTASVTAEGENRGVLHQQESVANRAGFTGFDDFAHDPQAFGVRDAAELEQIEDLHLNLEA